MKISLLLLLNFLAVCACAQETKEATFDGHSWQAPYTLATPKGWGVERFPIPISFAPAIAYKGVEDIRFAPGWAKQKSSEYWSYAFLWYLEGKVNMDTAIISKNLNAYYTGLISANAPNAPAEKMIPVTTTFKAIQRSKGDISTYSGTIRMFDYMTQQPILLRCIVHLRTCSNQNNTFVFYELSPQPLTHPVWKKLDKLWQQFKCPAN